MSDRRILTLPSQLVSLRRYVDNSVGVNFRSTLEVSVADMAALDTLLRARATGHMLFAENRLSESDVPKEDAPSDGRKSQSQIIRGLLWHIWDKKTDHSERDEDYIYRRRQRLIEALKEELDG
jgi:hypothetical protein